MKIKNYAWLLAIALIACESDDEETIPPFEGTEDTKSYVVVGNQGGFLANNASITLYDIEDNVATQEVFASANDNESLGDVLQSIYHYNNEVYVVLNNSSKVEVLNDTSFVRNRTIVGLSSPRYMHFVSNEKAYVSENNFGPTGNKIDIVNPSNGTYLGAINTEYSIENMLEHNGEVWCTSTTDGKVITVNSITDEIVDEIALAPNASDIVVDGNGKIWVLSQGQGSWAGPEMDPALFRINPETKTVEANFMFPAGTGFGGNMQISADKNDLLILMNGDILKMNIDDTGLPTSAFIDRAESFYGISVNPENGDIFLTDAADFASIGMGYVYSIDGEVKNEIEAGIIPWMCYWD